MVKKQNPNTLSGGIRLAATRCSISVKLDEARLCHTLLHLSRFSLNAAPSPTPVLPPSPTLSALHLRRSTNDDEARFRRPK
ncbi:hypothetical protein Dimus_012910, partial [Dionaea muscipula]